MRRTRSRTACLMNAVGEMPSWRAAFRNRSRSSTNRRIDVERVGSRSLGIEVSSCVHPQSGRDPRTNKVLVHRAGDITEAEAETDRRSNRAPRAWPCSSSASRVRSPTSRRFASGSRGNIASNPDGTVSPGRPERRRQLERRTARAGRVVKGGTQWDGGMQRSATICTPPCARPKERVKPHDPTIVASTSDGAVRVGQAWATR